MRGEREKRQLAPKRAGRWPTSPRIRNQQISRPRGLTNPKLSTRDKKEISDAVTVHPGLSLWYLFALKSHAGQFCSEIGVAGPCRCFEPSIHELFFFLLEMLVLFFITRVQQGRTRCRVPLGVTRDAICRRKLPPTGFLYILWKIDKLFIFKVHLLN